MTTLVQEQETETGADQIEGATGEHKSIQSAALSDNLEALYFADTAKLALISTQEERSLFEERDALSQERKGLDKVKDVGKIVEIEQRLERITERVVTAHVRFVICTAKEYLHRGLPLIDLIALGNIGMLEAFRRFDVQRGFKFISYAVWWIRQSIMMGLLNESRVVRISPSAHGVAQIIMGTLRRAEQLYGENIDPVNSYDVFKEMIVDDPKLQAKFGGLSRAHYREVLAQAQIHCSLNSVIYPEGSEGDGIEHINRLEAKSVESDMSLLFRDSEELVQQLLSFLVTKDPRLKVIIEHRYGLNGREVLTLEVIGRHLGITRERVRQLHNRAIEFLQWFMSSLSLSKEEVLHGN